MLIARPPSTIRSAGANRRLDRRGRESFTIKSCLPTKARGPPSSMRSMDLEEQEDIRGDIRGDPGLGRILELEQTYLRQILCGGDEVPRVRVLDADHLNLPRIIIVVVHVNDD